MEAPTDKPENQSSLSFGWLSFRPRCLQILNTPKWFLFFLSQYFFTQSVVVNGIFPGSISTIERRFGLTRYVYFCEVCSALIEVLLIRFVSSEERWHHPPLPPIFYSQCFYPHFASFCKYCISSGLHFGDHETPCTRHSPIKQVGAAISAGAQASWVRIKPAVAWPVNGHM